MGCFGVRQDLGMEVVTLVDVRNGLGANLVIVAGKLGLLHATMRGLKIAMTMN
jgi:hypothetical protein